MVVHSEESWASSMADHLVAQTVHSSERLTAQKKARWKALRWAQNSATPMGRLLDIHSAQTSAAGSGQTSEGLMDVS